VRGHQVRAALVGLGTGLLLTSCVVRPVVVRTPPPPPPPRAEVIVPQPGPAHVWIAGHWAWDGRAGAYVWRPGYWAVPEAPTQVWVPAHWAARAGGYVWVEGHWRVR
jgi:WXXGXW repeat (2 copies)